MSPLTAAERRAILRSAAEDTRAGFAVEVAMRTKLAPSEVLKLASTAEERDALAKVLAEVSKATGTNEARARSIRDIAGGVEALVKLARLVV